MILPTPLLLAAASACNPNKTFFGLPVWYKYLKTTVGTAGVCEFPNFVFPNDLALVGLAVIDALLRIAGLVAIAYVIIGGIQYVTSQGSPDRTKSAQETVINALIGLVLAIAATALVSFIGSTIKN